MGAAGEGASGSPGDPGIGVFVSAVSTEFASARLSISNYLSANEWEVREQTDFNQGNDTTILERLHTYIAGCSTVVCVIGRRSGSLPSRKASHHYIGEYLDFLPDDFTPSYTQWELIFAHQMKKRLAVFHANDDYTPDKPDAVDDDDSQLQKDFVKWIFGPLDLYRKNFSTNDELAGLLKDVEEAWKAPTADGPKVRADLTRHGLRGAEESLRLRLRASHEVAPSLSSDSYEMRGRERERSTLEAYLTRAKEQIVEVVGPHGVGKKKLLSQFENAEALLSASSQDLDRVEDLVQSAWESLVGPPPGTVLPERRDRELAQTEALVFAADVDSNDQLRILLDAMPRARFCVTATEPITADARRLELRPLRDDEREAMFEIFADRYVLPIPPELKSDIVEICRSVRGSPSCIVQLALDAERAVSLEEWVAERKPLTTEGLPSDMVLDADTRDPASVAAAVDEVLPRDVVVAATSLEAADRAEAGCLIMRGSPRYRLNSTRAAVTQSADENREILSDVLVHTVDWARMVGASEIFDNRSFVVRMMRWGIEHERWGEVLEIGQHCEPAMALRGRHGAWEEVLECSLAAARALGDGAAEGWALHEMGTRSLLRDEMPLARTQLAEAMECRLVHDPEAADLTRRNLRLVPGAVVSVLAVLVAALLSLTWVVAVVDAADMTDSADPPPPRATAKITPEVAVFAGPGEPIPVSIENVGDAPFAVDVDRLDLPAGFRLEESESTCTGALEPPVGSPAPPIDERRCRLSIRYDGVEASDASGSVAVLVAVPMSPTEDGAATVDGDRRILLIADAAP